MSGSEDSQPTPGLHVFRGSAWMIALRWATRAIGLLSTLVLVRLLTPADFGIVAMAMMLVVVLEAFAETGQRAALIRMPSPSREHYDAAWTISIGVGLVVGSLIFLAAPLAAQQFHDWRTLPVIQCLAFKTMVEGFTNIGIVNLRKDLQFERFFAFTVYAKIASFVTTLTLAWWLRNYWALVAGIMVQQVMSVVLSYTMSSYRPRLSLAKIRDIWSFSIWSLAHELGYELNVRADQFVVSALSGPAQMGRYAVALDIASSPSEELITPMVATVFPVMATVQNEPDKLRHLYLRTLCWSAIICAATSTGVALVSTDMASVILGPQWLGAAPLMAWLALAAGANALTQNAYSTFNVLNFPHISARMQWVRLAMLVAALWAVAIATHQPVAIAATKFAVTVLFIPTMYVVAGRIIGVTAAQYASILWRPFAAAGFMALAVWGVNQLIAFSGIGRLTLDVIVGAIAYPAVLIALWHLSGRPDTAERDAIGMAMQRLGLVREP